MKIKSALSVAWTLFFATGVGAQLYQGELTSSVPHAGTVGGFSWGLDIGNEVDFWLIHAEAGQFLNIAVTRETAGLDPAFSLYFGTTTANPAAFRHMENWGGLTFLTFADDEAPPAIPGPFGDPLLLNYLIRTTGDYTVAIGGFESASPGQGGYSVCAKVLAVHTGHDSLDAPCDLIPNPIPNPPTMLLLVAALLAAAVVRLQTRRVASRGHARADWEKMH